MPIKIAVIGHTNVGKTSLMRTLTRNQSFGDVQNAAATTRHVEMSRLDIGSVSLQLYDTPGLEDASSVMDYLIEHTDPRDDGVTKLQRFCQAVNDSTDTDAVSDLLLGDYSQEAKVISALMSSDIALYVIDSREPVLSKYQDELAIVAWSGVPVLPVFNFVKDSDNLSAWRQMLARRSLHVVSVFDTVAYDFDNEIKLWQNLATLSGNPKFHILLTHRQEAWLGMLDDGKLLIADFLVNVAAFMIKINEDDNPILHINAMQSSVRQAEQQLHAALLEQYKFYNYPVSSSPLAVSASVSDPFDVSQLSRFGIRAATGGTAGAIVGMGIDVMTLGASLGLGTIAGGVIGGALGNAQSIKDKITKQKSLIFDDKTLLVLGNRACLLHHRLRHTGHASTAIGEPEISKTSQDDSHAHWSTLLHDKLDSTLKQHTSQPAWQVNALPKPLKQARYKPHYSSLEPVYSLEPTQVERSSDTNQTKHSPNLSPQDSKAKTLRLDLAVAVAGFLGDV